MRQPDTNHPRSSSTIIYLCLFALSVVTNIILVVKLYYPDILEDLQLVLLPTPRVNITDHIRGNPNAKNTVIEYSDFQCPYCTKFHANMQVLVSTTDTRWVYRHFASEPIAVKASESAECASEQGAFWKYADALFKKNTRFTEKLSFDIAGALGLNLRRFRECLTSGKYHELISSQYRAGKELRIIGTPTFYFNGKRFVGFVTLEKLKQALNKQ